MLLLYKKNSYLKEFSCFSCIKDAQIMIRLPSDSWLDSSEQEDVVERLLGWDLIKYNNNRNLPLKSGGKTDVYINLRDARNHPEAIAYISGLFSNPLRRLGIDRFAEIPDAVSCFAGPLSQMTGLPYITIRDQPKEGRVSSAMVIGSPRIGDRVAIIDDVITDGASKVRPYQECKRLGLAMRSLVVLVDRQQGWHKTFVNEGIGLHVWSGMTLHDVRRHLIQTFGVMERCSKEVEENNPLIVALDGKDWDEILPIVDELRPTGCIFKVNDLLVQKGADWLVPNLSVYGRVMVDIKGHDIPNTVQNIARRLIKHPPWAVTVHASGGEEMMKAAVKAFEGTPTKVLAVTVLTSMDGDACHEVYRDIPRNVVIEFASLAWRSGIRGFVCSPEEVGMLKTGFPEAILVVPGIRSESIAAGDQKRTGTPKAAWDAGADYFVMGRQILGAKNPVVEVHRVLEKELEIVL